ncbi:hypothetical protein [Streptomyces sp. HNM0574]|uniref:hypothetical protein n=1 Tax=Streptomyces sp. HNM0574 TaxID=2714954 RepID=UPI00146EC79C|nr:hypothetical protein [Streptomyces sp. HNM0574]NLU67838.1 hypothetical protein [Streptomyces sp. HNM0574]
MTRALRTTLLAAGGTALALGLTACGSMNPFDRHQERSEYKTGAEAKEDRASMPRWLPDDARDVKYVLSTTGDDRLLSFTPKDGKLPAPCKPGKPQGEPQLKADWFPEGTAAKAGTNCGTWSGHLADGTFTAWQDKATVR